MSGGLAEFDWSFNPKIPRQACFQLNTLKFIAAGENGLIIGKLGTGKSHVAKAVAYQAVLQGHKVQYLETDDFFNHYELSAPEQRQTRLRANTRGGSARAGRPVPGALDP